MITEKRAEEIRDQALEILKRISDIVMSDDTEPEALVVAMSAQATLAIKYLAEERPGSVPMTQVLLDVGHHIAELIHEEESRLQSEQEGN
jgi:hypothetical protein